MSDESGTAVATEGVTSTETAAPEPTAPAQETPAGGETAAQPTPEKPQYLTKREARAQMHADMEARQAEAAKAAEAAKPDETGRKRGPDGKFLPADDSGEGQEQAAETAAAEDTKPKPAAEPQATEQDTGPDAEAADEAAQGVRVEIEPDHPLASQFSGDAAITVATEQDAERVKALLKGTYHRRREVEDLSTEVTELRKQLQEATEKVVGFESHQTAEQKFKSTPEYRKAVETHQRILEEEGEDEAARYWKGVQTEFQEFVDTERQERTAALNEQTAEAAAAKWQRDVWRDAQERLPEYVRDLPDLQGWFQEELELFNDRLEKGRYPHIQNPEQMHAEFRKLFAARLRMEPSVREAAQRISEAEARRKSDEAREKVGSERSIEAAKKEGADELRRAAAEARADTPPNPAANLPAPAGGRPSGVETDDGVDTSQMSPGQLRKYQKQLARQDGVRHLGG